MATRKPPRFPPQPGAPRPSDEGDRIFGVDQCALLFGVTKGIIYHWNDDGIPYYKPGKGCFYLYSQVMNWFLSSSSLHDEGKRWEPIPLSELPKCWPIYPGGERLVLPEPPAKEDEKEEDDEAEGKTG
ncbi:hypothetical protein [Kocuria rosea]|uniref:hypothetical protein n=1 Tax=Kocuria rosea TaxID=1275 RepID=UPI002540EB01|nr:hypothetical protein [Kocuria rosea]WIG18374.1 hypothetical protein QOY29_05450 [Kocuria rosea]